MNILIVIEYYTFNSEMTNLKQKYNLLPQLIRSPPTSHQALEFLRLPLQSIKNNKKLQNSEY